MKINNEIWAKFVAEHRQQLGLTKRNLAELVNIDASYITLIENKGCTPRRDKVIKIAKALNTNVDQTLLVAGYAPDKLSKISINISNLSKIDETKDLLCLVPALQASIDKLAKLDDDNQVAVAKLIDVFLQPLHKIPKNSDLKKGNDSDDTSVCVTC
ncbi:helix-turn-helix transcriptional regulator [bacterium]|nr:helix-turn-helix transcriptional regulator [bacterium]